MFRAALWIGVGVKQEFNKNYGKTNKTNCAEVDSGEQG